MPENDDVIHMLLKAGIPYGSFTSCEVLMVEGVLLVSRALEAKVSTIRGRLEGLGIRVVVLDLPAGGMCLDKGERALALDAVIEALAGYGERLSAMPLVVTPRYLLVNCDMPTLAEVLEIVPSRMSAAGFGDLPLIVGDFDGSGEILHNASMSASVQEEAALTDESMSELSRLLSSTCSVDEFLKALG